MHKVNESTQNKYTKKSSMIALKAYHCKVCWPWPSLRYNKKNNYTNTINAMIMSGINGLNVHCVQCAVWTTLEFVHFLNVHILWICVYTLVRLNNANPRYFVCWLYELELTLLHCRFWLLFVQNVLRDFTLKVRGLGVIHHICLHHL